MSENADLRAQEAAVSKSLRAELASKSTLEKKVAALESEAALERQDVVSVRVTELEETNAGLTAKVLELGNENAARRGLEGKNVALMVEIERLSQGATGRASLEGKHAALEEEFAALKAAFQELIQVSGGLAEVAVKARNRERELEDLCTARGEELRSAKTALARANAKVPGRDDAAPGWEQGVATTVPSRPAPTRTLINSASVVGDVLSSLKRGVRLRENSVAVHLAPLLTGELSAGAASLVAAGAAAEAELEFDGAEFDSFQVAHTLSSGKGSSSHDARQTLRSESPTRAAAEGSGAASTAACGPEHRVIARSATKWRPCRRRLRCRVQLHLVIARSGTAAEVRRQQSGAQVHLVIGQSQL
jgi:hypothetical protein